MSVPTAFFPGNPRPISSISGKPESKILQKPAAAGAPLLIFLLFLSLAATIRTLPGIEPDPRYAILLVGASGNPDLQKRYLAEIQKLHSILTGPLSFPLDQVIVLFDNPALDTERIRYRSTREGVREACLNLSRRVKQTDTVFVFIEGHGSYDGKTYKLNLVDPDTTAWELADIIYSIPAGRFVVVNATSSSGGSLPALAGEGKIVITATKSGMEGNQTHMGGFFVESLEGNAADSNKDDRVSVLEAFFYTISKVEEYYRDEENLQTEHAVLEDNGDGLGQRDPKPENGEGLLARTTFFNRDADPEDLESLPPEQRNLALEAAELEKQIEALKYRKDEMPLVDYDKKLEELLLRLAQINAKLQN